MGEEAKRSRWPRRLVLLALVALIALNLVAFMHAGAMTTWSTEGEVTEAPDRLGMLEKLRVLATGVSVPRPTGELTPLAFGLEYENVSIPDGHDSLTLEAWYLPGADDEIVAVLFPGYAASKEAMLPHALAFLDLGASVLLVDFHGVGDSHGSGTSLGIFEARDVLAAEQWVRATRPWAEVVLYGQSMGGAAVLRAVALEQVRPDAIVIESTFDRLLSAVSARFHRMGMPATPFAQLLVFWGGVRLGENGFEHAPVEFATSVTCPALVLHSADDSNISLEQARRIFDALGGWKRFAEYPDTGHGELMASRPARWSEDVAELLSQLQDGSL